MKAEEVFEQVCQDNDENGNWTLDEYKKAAPKMLKNIVQAMEEYAQHSAQERYDEAIDLAEDETGFVDKTTERWIRIASGLDTPNNDEG